jgi:hypothetical protein
MSQKQILESIKVYFDRVRELINPIDEERLKLDSVNNLKSTVREFYLQKNKFGGELLQELDKMNSERPGLLKIKSS